MPRDAVSRTAHVGTVGTNGLKTCGYNGKGVAKLKIMYGYTTSSLGKHSIIFFTNYLTRSLNWANKNSFVY